MKKQTAVELLKATIDTEVKLGTKMLINWDFYLSIERVELARADKLETLAKLLAKSWFYGDWEWENPNERIMQMLMQELGYYPFKNEDEMIYHTRVDEDLYKEAVDKVALINPRIMPVENSPVDTNKMLKQTAVEFLGHELNTKLFYNITPELWEQVNAIFEQAKAMEKQQSISDYCAGFLASGEGWNGEYGLKDMFNVAGEIDAEDYYNKTYGGEQ